MTDIGLELKEKREENGLSLEETASDLNISPLLLESLENGDKSSFGDVMELKQLIINYAKYLGIDENRIETEFNEFIFEYTSKIPVKEIEQATLNKVVKNEKIASPYTSNIEKKGPNKIVIIILSLILIIGIISIVAMKFLNNYSDDNIYVLRR